MQVERKARTVTATFAKTRKGKRVLEDRAPKLVRYISLPMHPAAECDTLMFTARSRCLTEGTLGRVR